ncbi:MULTISPECIES: hypothetical protein [Epilithonimonas]|nr:MULTISPECIES: hypothetical protein [Epilithonimonas]
MSQSKPTPKPASTIKAGSSKQPAPNPNWPSKTGEPSGKRRGNNL